MSYNAEYTYFEDDYLDNLILNYKDKNSTIWATLIPKELLKARNLEGLMKNETEESIKFLKENDIIPYHSLDFDEGFSTGTPRQRYFGSGSNDLITAYHEPFKTCIEPLNFLRKKWHAIHFGKFGNDEQFRKNIKAFIEGGYTTNSFYAKIYENGEEIGTIDGYLGKLKIDSEKILEGMIIKPKGILN